MDHPFVLVSMPLTGLADVITHLAEHLVWNEGIVYLGEWGDNQRYREGRPDTSVWSPGKRAEVKVLTGPDIHMKSHRFTGAGAGRYFTVIRDPADQMAAEYNSFLERGHDLPEFWQWYAERRPNRTTKFFQTLFGVTEPDDITFALKKFWFLTTTDHLDEDLPFVFREIGVPAEWHHGTSEIDLEDLDPEAEGPAEPAVDPDRLVVVDDEMRDRIWSENPKDRRFYKYALRRRLNKRARYGWD